MAAPQPGTLLRHLRRLAAGPDATERSDRELLQAFRSTRDQAAFAALVRRHGPLVWGVCRHALGHVQDAEDAFQATFLVLARKADSIRNTEALVSWLHGVAHRTTMSAKRSAARRRAHEGRAPEGRPPANPAWELAWREVQALLDEEIGRLPEKYRAVFLLCCLENRSKEEAAGLLGIPEGTVGSRLTRARRQLRRRLERRGVALPAALAAVALGREPGRAVAVPLLRSTLDTALTTAATVDVARLARGVMRMMTRTRLQRLVGVLLALGTAVAGAGLLTRPAADARAPEQAAPAEPRPPAPVRVARAGEEGDEGQEVIVSGRVRGPDGGPVAGARLYLDFDRKDLVDVEGYLLTQGKPKEPPLPVRATTGADGRFRFTFRCTEQETAAASLLLRMVAAFAEGHGFDLAAVPTHEGTEVELRLTNPQPLRGRILDPDHNPVRGARVRVLQVARCTAAELDRHLEAVRRDEDPNLFLGQKTWLRPLPGPAAAVTAGEDGRFRLDGLGSDCIVMLAVEGPGIECGWVYVMTREAVPVRPPAGSVRDTVYGATFEHVARLGRVIRGTVRDRAGGAPLAGVRVAAWGLTSEQAFADQDGRYELTGVAKRDRYDLVAQPIRGQPFFLEEVTVADERGIGPITADIALTRGVPLEGRVTDRQTGKPLPGATVEYYPLPGNTAALKVLRGFRNQPALAETMTRADGSYRLAVVPGPGFVAVRSGFLVRQYMPALVTPREVREFFKGTEIKGVSDDLLPTLRGVGSEGSITQVAYHALLLLNPEAGTESLRRDIALETGRTLTGTVVGPDGEPVAGASVEGLEGGDWFGPRMTLAGAEFTLRHVNPRRRVELVFRQPGRRLGALCVVNGDEPGPLTVRLRRCGAVAGRLLDRDGRPARGVVLGLFARKDGTFSRLFRAETDRDGRYRFDGLVPGQEHILISSGGTASYTRQDALVVQPGEVKTVRDIKPLGDG
jgi:RNA polymerase sigma factor (sigma-70 family)